MSKEELSEFIGVKVQSIENQQLIRDPLTGNYHLYLSIDIAGENIAGWENRVFESKWVTYLLISDDPVGPWEKYGFVLVEKADYDTGEARDCSIDIIDGRYFCLYKARRKGESRVNTALAISSDGKKWVKLGIPTLDGKKQPEYYLLSGSIFPGCCGPIFMGCEATDVVKGAALTKYFVSYIIDYRNLNLETIFRARWEPGSMYEHPEYPIHTYTSITYDQFDERWLIAVEAVDPKFSETPGLNTEVDRLLLYVSE